MGTSGGVRSFYPRHSNDYSTTSSLFFLRSFFQNLYLFFLLLKDVTTAGDRQPIAFDLLVDSVYKVGEFREFMDHGCGT